MTNLTKLTAVLATLLVAALSLVTPARAQDEVDGKTYPERQLEKRNKERREAEREKSRRDPQTPLYVPSGPPASAAPAPWSSTAPRQGSGSVPWNTN